MTGEQTLKKLYTSLQGLSDEEATSRLKVYGANRIEKKQRSSPLLLFFSQFKDVMTILLIAAAAISGVIAFVGGEKSDLYDTAIILAIILLNAIAGTVQEYRADRAIDGLQKLSPTYAKVRRGGVERKTESDLVTVGDIICLDEGDMVCADCAVLASNSLICDEAALTGESVGVEKFACTAENDGRRAANMLFKGTFVLRGTATAVVLGVGRNTRIGQIADMLDRSDKGKTPLEKSLDKLGKVISLFVLGVAAIIFIMGAFVRGGGILKNFMTAVAVAVAAIPEGLPAVVTIIMAMGVQRMSRENVVIRKLRCVETLGGCTCICTDKTGTLTNNRMRAVKVYADFKEQTDSAGECMHMLAACASICTDVKGERGAYVGDPTEIALKEFSADFNGSYEVIGKVPFTSERKLMSVSAKYGGETRLYVKGAPDILLKKCDKVLTGGGVIGLTEGAMQTILRKNDEFSGGALRVLALACRDGAGTKEEELVFLGLIGLADSLKNGVKEAVSECARAGITTVMITGDHAKTAFAIAKKAGIASDMSEVVTGEQLDSMTKSQRVQAVRDGRVFARVTPAHKNIIVRLKRSAGEVVAMTGDGVNDAPSIKSADIGIAMGKSGTDVTKSVADMVIADDNFTTIVTAVREGRRIFANIKKTIQFFLSTNLAEVLAVLVAALAFFRNDFLLSTQLLWINLITDSFPVLALGTERGDFGAMSRPPERAEKSLFSKSSLFIILFSGLYIAGAAIGVYVFALTNYGNKTATTMTFLTISFMELFHAFNVRSESTSSFKRGEPVNKILISTVVVGVAVNILLAATPLAAVFGLVTLSTGEWGIVAVVSLSVLPFGELYKFILRSCEKKEKWQGLREINLKK